MKKSAYARAGKSATRSKKDLKKLRIGDVVDVYYKDCTKPLAKLVVGRSGLEVLTVPLSALGKKAMSVTPRTINSDRWHRVYGASKQDGVF